MSCGDVICNWCVAEWSKTVGDAQTSCAELIVRETELFTHLINSYAAYTKSIKGEKKVE